MSTDSQLTFTCSNPAKGKIEKSEICEICSKSTIKSQERHWCRSGDFVVNFEHISHFFLLYLLLILNKSMLVG